MGVYDSVWVKCPSCNHRIENQSKSGDCILANYNIEDAPQDVLEGIETELHCYNCNHHIKIKMITKTIKVTIPIVE